jgi:hypothetical protein
MEVVEEMRGVISPGQGDDLDRISLGTKIFDQFAVIQITPADGLQRTIDDQA